MARFYRFLSRDRGIYEAVDEDCPKGDPRRIYKPDGSWLPKVGMNYPGAISFWKEKGLKIYKDSGLLSWQKSVVCGPVKVMIINNRQKEILYEDDYQIIFNPKFIPETKIIKPSQ